MPAKEYDYLLTMQIMSLTEERVAEMQRLMGEKKQEFERLAATTIHQIWKADIQRFLQELDKHEA